MPKNQPNCRSGNAFRMLLMLVFFIVTKSQMAAFQTPIRTIECATVTEIKNAMNTAKPGDEIVISSGTYTSNNKYNVVRHITLAARFYSKANGTAQNPIIIRGKNASNPPILQGPSNAYDGYVFLLEGNHWIIKDLKMKSGSKGLMLDNANNVTIENIEVYDIASEGIHVRDGSTNTTIKNCYLHDLGVKQERNGEGVYVGSDAKEHNGNFNPFCNNTTITGCTFGPNISAEAIDIKEETDGTKIYNNSFSAKGILGDDRNDAFIDAKGINTYIYNNVFNVDNGGINAGIDVVQKKPKNDQGPIQKTGYRVAVFKNTFNLGSNSSNIPVVRFKGGKPYDIHMWDNKRNPNTPEPNSYFSDDITNSCPSWNILPCNTTGGGNPTPTPTPTPNNINEITSINAPSTVKQGQIALISVNYEVAAQSDLVVLFQLDTSPWTLYKEVRITVDSGEGTETIDVQIPSNVPVANDKYQFQVFIAPKDGTWDSRLDHLRKNDVDVTSGQTPAPNPTPTPNPNPPNCSFGAPQNSSLPTLKMKYNTISTLGNGGPNASNLKRFTINWNASKRGLYSFAFNTRNGNPAYYVDLNKSANTLDKSNPDITISNSGISGLDGNYWVTTNGNDFVLVSKSGNYSIYCSNNANTPSCAGAKLSKKTFTLTLSPNPATDLLQISGLPETEMIVSIFDLQGKLMQQEPLRKGTNTVPVSALTSGMYLIILTGNQVNESKLISIK